MSLFYRDGRMIQVLCNSSPFQTVMSGNLLTYFEALFDAKELDGIWMSQQAWFVCLVAAMVFLVVCCACGITYPAQLSESTRHGAGHPGAPEGRRLW
jgi:hypothetical protein